MKINKIAGLMLASSMFLVACGSEDSEVEDTSTEEDVEQVEVEEDRNEEDNIEEDNIEEEDEEVKEQTKPTREQNNAIKDADSYLREGDRGEKVKGYLEEQGYSEDAVEYAMEGLATIVANSIEGVYDRSRGGVPEVDVSELESMMSNYPKELVDYAIGNLDVDFNEQALWNAQNIYEGSNEQIKQELLEKGFTEEQAQYAIGNLD